MFESHFGIARSPFQLTPDPWFYFPSRGHDAAMALLRRGCGAGQTFIVVSGEIGSGKSMLVRGMLDELAPSVLARYLGSTQLTGEELQGAVATAFGIALRDTAQSLDRAFAALLASLREQGKRALLIVDEAQHLDPEGLRMLHGLASPSADGPPLFEIWLVGQPELRQRLAHIDLLALRERVAASCHLGPLDEIETRAYVLHRLRKAGWSGRPEFDAAAFGAIYRGTGGLPRQINRLCNRLLLSSYLSSLDAIDADEVARAADDLQLETQGLQAPDLEGPVPAASKESGGRGAAVADFVALREEATPDEEVAGEEAPDQEAPEQAAPEQATPEEEAPVGEVPAGEVPAGEASALPILDGQQSEDGQADPAPQAAAAPSDAVPAQTQVAPPRSAPSGAVLPQAAAAPLPAPQLPLRGAVRAAGVMIVVDGQADHIKAAALLHALREREGTQDCTLVRACDNDALALHQPLFGERDVIHGVTLGVAEGAQIEPAERTRQVAQRFERLLQERRPQAVIVIDGSSLALACAVEARRQDVPVISVGAGVRLLQRTRTSDITRILTDRLAQVLYADDEAAAQNLKLDGVAAERIHCVGSISADALALGLRTRARAAAWTGFPDELLEDRRGFGLVVLEQPANVERRQRLAELVHLLRQARRDLPLVWVMSRRTDERLKAFGFAQDVASDRIACLPRQPYPAFARLLDRATCVLSDSTAIQDEALLLGVPCLGFFDPADRPCGAGARAAIAIGTDVRRMTRSLWGLLYGGAQPTATPALWDGQACSRMAEHFAAWMAGGPVQAGQAAQEDTAVSSPVP